MLKLELDKEWDFKKLQVRGTVPRWLEGTLFRNGPVLYQLNDQYPVHWFDGLGMLHAFNINNGNIFYTNKFIHSTAYNNVIKGGSPHYLGFACDPCHELFKRIFTSFFASSHHDIHNANVNVAKYAQSFVGLTETPLPVIFDPQTLATNGVFDFSDALSKENVFESAHPHYNTVTGEYINYIVKYGIKTSYQVYRLKKNSSSRELFAEIPIKNPAYMHTFSLTENTIIFAEYPFTVNPLAMLLTGKPFIKNYHWQEGSTTRFLFINRHNGKVEKEFHTDPFFSFHHINAYEKENQVILDLIAYPDASIIATIGKYGQPDYSQCVNQGLANTKLLRFCFFTNQNQFSKETLFEGPIEFPRINPNFDARMYRYFYGADIREPQKGSNLRPIYKMDLSEKNMKTWEENACYPGEPVFIPHPQTTEEDAGVLAIVLFNQEKNSSEILLLDASTMQEIARAAIGLKVPLGLHGQFYRQE